MIRSYKKISQLNNSIQGGITCQNLNIQNQLISSQIIYQSYTGSTGVTGYEGPINYGLQTGPTGFNVTGPTGMTGYTNYVNGFQGYTGPTGPIGYNITGSYGPTGDTGTVCTGSIGSTGHTGANVKGPTGPTISYTKISETFTIVGSTIREPITTISLNSSCYVQWYVNIESTNTSNTLFTIYFGFDQDEEMIPVYYTTSISGSGIYDSDIIFQYFYDGPSSDLINISYQIGYVQLFN